MFSTNEERKAFVAKFNIIDDVFFQKVVEDREACQEILQIIMAMPSLKVKSVQVQKSLRNIGNKSVTLDVLCQLEDGKLYNIEMQRSDNDDHIKRVRYYVSNLDTMSAERGIHYRDLPDLYMVYITSKDFLEGNKPIYHVQRILEETGILVYNGINEIYVNAAVDDGSTLAELMQYFKRSTSESAKFPKVAARVKYFKETNEGVSAVCEIVQELIAKELKRAEIAESEAQAAKSEAQVANAKAVQAEQKAKLAARKMYDRGDSVEVIADLLSEKVETVEAWLKSVA